MLNESLPVPDEPLAPPIVSTAKRLRDPPQTEFPPDPEPLTAAAAMPISSVGDKTDPLTSFLRSRVATPRLLLVKNVAYRLRGFGLRLLLGVAFLTWWFTPRHVAITPAAKPLTAATAPSPVDAERSRTTFNAQKLIIWAGSNGGRIFTSESRSGGLILRIGGRSICTGSSLEERESADWRAALRMLDYGDLIERGRASYTPRPSEEWRLTSQGYATFDSLKTNSPLTVQAFEDAFELMP
jgi:hypothetical protein